MITKVFKTCVSNSEKFFSTVMSVRKSLMGAKESEMSADMSQTKFLYHVISEEYPQIRFKEQMPGFIVHETRDRDPPKGTDKWVDIESISDRIFEEAYAKYIHSEVLEGVSTTLLPSGRDVHSIVRGLSRFRFAYRKFADLANHSRSALECRVAWALTNGEVWFNEEQSRVIDILEARAELTWDGVIQSRQKKITWVGNPPEIPSTKKRICASLMCEPLP